MKIDYAHYTLHGRHKEHSRQGALLRVAFDDGSVGYADCHPWPEFGSLPLKKQLEGLAEGKTTALTARSLQMARIDAGARKEKRSLFENLEVPISHYLLADIEDPLPKGVSYFKLKLGKDPEKEKQLLPLFFQKLPSKSSVSFDFNARLDESAFAEYLELFAPHRQKIEFIEDPFPLDVERWELLSGQIKIPFAQDLAMGEGRFSGIRVVKPAIEDPEEILKTDSAPIVITSCLDHPIGQLSAAYEAARLQKLFSNRFLPCGLMTHFVYQTNKYSADFGSSYEKLAVPVGTGWGFDAYLEDEPWQSIGNRMQLSCG